MHRSWLYSRCDSSRSCNNIWRTICVGTYTKVITMYMYKSHHCTAISTHHHYAATHSGESIYEIECAGQTRQLGCRAPGQPQTPTGRSCRRPRGPWWWPSFCQRLRNRSRSLHRTGRWGWQSPPPAMRHSIWACFFGFLWLEDMPEWREKHIEQAQNDLGKILLCCHVIEA